MNIPALRRSVVTFVLAMLLLLVVLGVAVWGFSPYGMRYFLSGPLKNAGLTLDDTTIIRYNPFNTRLTIKNFSVSKRTDKPLQIESASLSIGMLRSVWGDIYVSDFLVEGLSVVVLSTNGQFNVAGMSVSLAQSELFDAISRGLKKIGKSIILPEFALINGQIIVVSGENIERFYINSLRVFEGTFTESFQTLQVELDAEFEESKVQISSKIDMESGDGVIASKVDVKDLDLAFVQAYLSADLFNLHSGVFSGSADLIVTITDGISKVSLGGLVLDLKRFHL